eukprot:jgi/Phyca11/7530/fgenesh1_pm.PHYCAscaffold_20_\
MARWKTILALICTLSPLLVNAAEESCPNDCSGKGICTKQLTCNCHDGFFGYDCSLQYCPVGKAWGVITGTDEAHAPAECSGRGVCVYTSGSCMVSRELYDRDVFVYDELWDFDVIHGCHCDTGFHGPSCSLKDCSVGDDPLTTGQVNEFLCGATSVQGGGSFTVNFRGFTTRPIPAQSTTRQLKALLLELPSIQGIDVSYSGSQICETPANLARLTFTQNFGNLPTIVTDNSSMCADSSVVVAGGGSTITGVASVDGTKESEVCSNRGYCDDLTVGHCICHTGYTNSDGNGSVGTLEFSRGDCGALSRIPVGCPGDLACSGHGTCSGTPSYRCSCAKGWQGGDCSERVCPSGRSWFGYPSDDNVAHQLWTECSGVGECDRSNAQCKCHPPYTGSACEFNVECNGFGECLTLNDLAPFTRVNGVTRGFTYGEDPNDVSTWDARRIRTCLCDPLHLATIARSVKECPRGDDFYTNGVIERQLVQCIADAGSFTLSFRDETTVRIPFDAAESVVKAALEELSTIGEVNVAFSSGAMACSNSVNTVMMVDFLTELGDLPSLSENVWRSISTATVT